MIIKSEETKLNKDSDVKRDTLEKADQLSLSNDLVGNRLPVKKPMALNV